MLAATHRCRHPLECKTACWTCKKTKPNLSGATPLLVTLASSAPLPLLSRTTGIPAVEWCMKMLWLTPHWLLSSILILPQQQVLITEKHSGLKITPSCLCEVIRSNKHAEGWAARKVWRLAYITASERFVKQWNKVWFCQLFTKAPSLHLPGTWITMLQDAGIRPSCSTEGSQSWLTSLPCVPFLKASWWPPACWRWPSGQTAVAEKFLVSSVPIQII